MQMPTTLIKLVSCIMQYETLLSSYKMLKHITNEHGNGGFKNSFYKMQRPSRDIHMRQSIFALNQEIGQIKESKVTCMLYSLTKLQIIMI